jgi:phosphonate transport system substrate-binding protein
MKKGKDKIAALFISPASEKGRSTLRLDENMWLYWQLSKVMVMHTLRGNVVLFRIFLAAVCLSVGFYGLTTNAEEKSSAASVYSFGVVPQFEQRKLHAIWKPILDELGRRTGLHFKLASTLTIRDFHKSYRSGQFDFVYVNPYTLVHLHKVQGYIPLVTDKKVLRGIIVARKDSKIKTVADLNGKTLAFPSPNAWAASLLVRADLDQIHHVKITPLYVKTHSSMYLHVAQGLTVAGGGVEKTLLRQKKAIRDELKVIYTTRASPSHPIAAHPRVPQDIRGKVRKALLAMSETPEGKKMLAGIPIKNLIPVTYEGNYAVIGTWGVDKYWQPLTDHK